MGASAVVWAAWRILSTLVDADVRAAVEELGGLCGGKASDVGGGADAVEPESSIGGDRGSR